MFSIPTIITALLAAGAPLVASAPVATENKLEARQNPTVVRLFRHRNHNGNDYSDMGIEEAGKCQSLPTSIISDVSSFKLGVWKCRFFEGANCSGHNQWFDSDWNDLRVGGGNYGYKGESNDDYSSVICSL